MTGFHIEGTLVALQFLAAAIGVSAVTALLVAMGYGMLRKFNRAGAAKPYWQVVAAALPYVFLLAVVGGLAGQLGGGSRSPVVGQLVPAIMALFGPFLAYFLGTKRDPTGKVSANALAFLLAFFVMYNVAAVWRQDNENWLFCRDLFANPDFDDEIELQTRTAFWWEPYCETVFNAATRPTASAS